jgi:hypothetical protein
VEEEANGVYLMNIKIAASRRRKSLMAAIKDVTIFKRKHRYIIIVIQYSYYYM